MEKDVGLKVFRTSFYGLECPIMAIFAPLFLVPINCRRIRSVLQFVTQDAKNCPKSLKMAHSGII
jgi:hypothetical protein